jgi:hypothetical protein
MRAAGDGLVAAGARPLPPVAGGATMLPGPENECGVVVYVQPVADMYAKGDARRGVQVDRAADGCFEGSRSSRDCDVAAVGKTKDCEWPGRLYGRAK